MSILFKNLKKGPLEVKNRIVLPPFTRGRSTQPGDIPNEMMAQYYAQRADAGLMITEGTQISKIAKGYAFTPGMYNEAQVEGWKLITKAIHDKGSVIFAQLWHVGRMSHPLNVFGDIPVAPSALKPTPKTKGSLYYSTLVPDNGSGHFGMIEIGTPREMTIEEIKNTIEDYRIAARNAIKAGFDGIELHAANGYLINQFLSPTSNKRTDEYGGSLENRLRFYKEVLEAIVSEIGENKVGVRLSPVIGLFNTQDENFEETFTQAIQIAENLSLVYLHIAESDWQDNNEYISPTFKKVIRDTFSNMIIYAGGFTKESAEELLNSGMADMVGFGRAFIANPDLVTRFENNYPLNELDSSTLMCGDYRGYTDYPEYK
ncbi:MAG: alkene reductase [Psittacicella sp.]